jgi:hypothetical protein
MLQMARSHGVSLTLRGLDEESGFGEDKFVSGERLLYSWRSIAALFNLTLSMLP